jgi:Bacterial Ig domain
MSRTRRLDPGRGPAEIPIGFSDELKFTFDYGDGIVSRGNCRTTHTYPYPPGPPSAVATICVGDGVRGHDSCQSYTVKVRNACANDTRPPSVSVDPPDGSKTPIVVSAQASDNVGVTAVEFFATGPQGALVSIGVDRDAPYRIQWRPNPACATFRLVARAHDACGNEDVSKPVSVTHSDPAVCGTPRPRSASAVVVLSSELRLTEGRGHVAVNGQASAPAAAGRSRASVPALSGDNLVEALVVDGKRHPGTWRFELAGEVVPGSLRVEAGEVVQVTGDAIVFRVTGKAGERIAFRFRGRP